MVPFRLRSHRQQCGERYGIPWEDMECDMVGWDKIFQQNESSPADFDLDLYRHVSHGDAAGSIDMPEICRCY